MRIDVYADVVCPWCYVGEKRLEKALGDCPDLDVERRWRPFQLRPEMPAGGVPWRPFALEKFGGEEGVRRTFAHVAAAGEPDGARFHFERVASAPNTVDAHRLILHAAGCGREWPMADALFRGYFTEGLDLNDPDHLAAIAADAGLDADEACAFLAGGSGTQDVWKSQGTAAELGIGGVPFSVIDGRYAVSGGQPAEVWLRTLDAVEAERVPRAGGAFAAAGSGQEASRSGGTHPHERSAMSEYEQTQAVAVPPDEAFAWLSDVGNLPDYLPPVTDASIEGPSEEDNPGQKVRTTLQYPGGEGSFDAEGYLAVDGGARRMEWGAEAGRDYSGWLEVAPDGDGSRVTVHLSFGERSVEPEMREEAGGDEDPLADGISATLESIRRQLEEGSGKVESSPPPDAGPQTEDNPAVVRDDPPDGR